MQYRIVGVNQKTGEEVRLSVTAESEHDAVTKANQRGVKPTSVRVVPTTQPAQLASGTPIARVAGERRQFSVEVVSEGALGTLFVGASRLPVRQMEEIMNRYGADGWDVSFMLIEQRRMLLFWTREAAIITFSRTV